MTFEQAIDGLEKAGTAQNRKVYARHGVGSNQFGVSFANLRALAKRVKTDQALADKLWSTGNHDARVLATLVADSSAISSGTLDQWARALDNYVIADLFSGLAGRTRFARQKAEKWIEAKREFTAQCGWNLIGYLAMNDRELDDRYFESLLARIEREIHGGQNRVKHAMYMALIGIGVRNPKLTKQALAAARRIGRVDVDHGETGCKTPDAADYIKRTLARKK
jgi:3-methyladenine DNA glycosylase AlkD